MKPRSVVPKPDTAIEFTDVSVRAWDVLLSESISLLEQVNWIVRPGEHWALVGPNGAGKTTVLGTVAGRKIPSAGSVRVLGKSIGSPGMRDPREHLGFIESTPKALAIRMSSLDVVLNGVSGSVAGQGRRRTQETHNQAILLLQRLGCADLLGRRYEDCSQGERQRILIARALIRSPMLLLLDEPTTGLDLESRERLLQAVASLAADWPDLATVTVTHRLEELAATTTHAMLLRAGSIVASGCVMETLTDVHLSACFGIPIEIDYQGGRWAARARAG